VEPRLDGGVRAIEERWTNQPELGLSRYVDVFGNSCRRTTIPAGESTLRYDALLEVSELPDRQRYDACEVRPQDLPDEALVFTLPSRFCPSDQLADAAWALFGSIPPGFQRVQAICDWVHNEVHFGYGSSTPMTTAADVFESRWGVCRDFAHLAVTLCRALNIPARYVFGYLPDIGVAPPDDPMDFVAWTEVFLDGGWWTFDPRNNQPRIGRVLIARGRDALDVAMVSTFGGPKLQSMTVWADRVN
jgi:transglutaminase-like putative cysteine protease